MYKIGISIYPVTADEKLFADIADAGIDVVETSVGILDADKDTDYKAYRKYAEKNGVELWSFHLPFAHFHQIEPSVKDATLRNNTVLRLSEYIKKAADMGIKRFVIHPSGEPIEETERGERLKYSCESLSKLARIAQKSIEGGVIAVEDLPRTCLGRDSSDILAILDSDSALRACFDTNHLLKEDNSEFVRKIGNRIITTHVSDYDFADERHWLPGEGKNDWNSILDALEAVGYEGVWLYELGFKTPATINRKRDLTCADFSRNARELFARKKLTKLI